MTIIGEEKEKIELFKYSKALDIIIGYYMIDIYTHSKYMRNIVTEFGKYR